MKSQVFLLFLYLFLSAKCMTDDLELNVSNNSGCKLWHLQRNGHCHCGITEHGVAKCNDHFISIKQGSCVTWDNVTGGAEVHRCLFTKWRDYTCAEHDFYHISITTIGEKLNHFTCGDYNRQGSYCSQCINGYGPAVFSDDAVCADCSKHQYFWIINIVFQLLMVTILCLFLILFQIKGTSSPYNVIIMYAQLATVGLKLGGNLNTRLVCYIGQTFTNIVVTTLGIFNLDFFHRVIPPLCVSPSFKSINVLLFDYIIAIYPLFLTMFIYICIEVYDRYRIILSFLSFPFRKCFNNTSWNPRRTILNTFATFLLLSYSKLLFTSLHLLLASPSYNSRGERISSSAQLFYDPTINFFHSEHIPYVITALFIILIFITLPPLLLLLYPTSVFKKCLTYLGFQRWDILHHIMDIFQGWYKDGTEGRRDYRPLSALYILFRIALSCELVIQMLSDNYNPGLPHQEEILGVFNVFLGMTFFVLQPYKHKWMSYFDGWIMVTVGTLLLLETTDSKPLYIIGGVAGLSTMALIFAYAVYHKHKKHTNFIQS